MKRPSLNHTYRLIWNELTQAWVAVAEFTRAKGKRSGGVVLAAALLSTSAYALDNNALPTGGTVSAGTGNISQNGSAMTIGQTSQNLAVNWATFNIGKDASVTFNQPNSSAIALNRVLGTDGSQILGRLNANGQVWVLNPNGVLFGSGAQVNVGGLVASTLGMSDADFLAGKRTFTGSGGSVVNQGSINATHYVALLGEQVKNEGVIVANLGTVALAAGNKITLDFAGDNLLGVQVDEGALHALVENNNLVQADGGLVVMTAKAKDALLDTAVNNTGIVRARTIENREGRILLLGDMDSGTVSVGGTLDASAPAVGAQFIAPDGDATNLGAMNRAPTGGFIETSAAHVKVADGTVVTTLAANGNNGTWLIDPVDYTIAASGGDMTGAALTTALSGGNVTILSTSGGAGTAGDVNVNDTVTWSANTLTLNAQNNININRAMMGSGTAGLALEYGQGAVAAGNTATYNVRAPINLASTGSFSTKLGSGGAVKNYTILTDVTALQGMSGNSFGNYVLGSNVDASATSGWNGGLGFMPVGNFGGIFDGLGHTISNLTINRPSMNYVGLFGDFQGATLRNVGIVRAQISGQSYVGALVGYVSSGDISYSYVEGGSVTGSGDYVGGLAGVLAAGSASQIGNSYSSATVSGVNGVGGLVGFNRGTGIISDSYATGAVSGNVAVGGLVGVNRNIITRSYSIGAVSGSSQVGGLVGLNSSGAGFSGNVSDSYWDIGTSGQADGVGFNNGTPTVTNLVGLATADAYTQANYANLDFTNTWWMSDGNTRPMLRSEYSTTIANAHQLQMMAMNLGASYTLAGDIDASETSAGIGMWASAGFVPVGTSATKFTGIFDGQNHTIDGLTINRPATDYVGLFGNASGATLSNIGLSNVAITGNDWVGALLGWGGYISVANVHVAGGSVTGTGMGTGGLVGTIDQVAAASSLSNSYAAVDVNGVTMVGGLLGLAASVSISDSYATGNVTATGSYAGGLAGSSTANASISSSYATGNVSGIGHVGGLVGLARCTVSDSYATGAVTGTDRVGGLVGANQPSGTITNSYATGAVSGSSNVGGLLGQGGGVVTASFWDTQTTGQATSVGGAGAVGKTTAEMKSLATFAGWDIDDAGGTGKVWRIYDGYTTPLLRGFMTTLNATPDYDGSGAALTNVAAYTISGAYDAGLVLGAAGTTLTLASTAADAYTATVKGLYSSQQGYDLVLHRTIATPGSASGDIALTNPISWTSGTLAINTAGTITDTAAINGTGAAIFDLQNGTWRQVNATLPGFNAFDFRLSGGTFIRALSGDGTVGTPYQLADIYGIQGMGSSGMLGLNYTLGADVAPGGTANWNAGAGFTSVGNSGAAFTGSFDGLGHTITGLTINSPGWNDGNNNFRGLFGYAGVGSTLRNVGLLNSSIAGANIIGTLAGHSAGTISNVYADGGSVTTSVHQAGGLVGRLGDGVAGHGSISNSYANVSVTGTNYACCGGGVSSSNIGGLVGMADTGSSISNSYATGAVHGGAYVGGLVGQNRANIDTSYASGAVTATSSRGGLIGDQLGGAITNSYWDSAATGVGTGTRSGNIGGLTDVAAAPNAQASYTGFDFAGSWRIYEGYTRPLLKSFMTALTVTANDATKTYDGAAYSGGNGVTYSATPNANLLGAVAYGGSSQGATNAGSYAITAGGLYSNQRGYDITYVDGALTVNKASLTLGGTRTYDGTSTVAGSILTATGVNGETFAVGGAGDATNLASKNVQTGSALASVTGLTLGASVNGGLASNYNALDTVGSSISITAKALTVGGISAANKTYDGTTAATVNTAGATLGGLVAGDAVTVTATGTFADKNVGTGKTVTLASAYGGADAGNYTIADQASTTADITAKALTIGGITASNKTYDGTAAATVNTVGATLTGLVAGDAVTVSASGAFTDKNVGAGKTVTLASSYSGTDAGNYVIADQASTTANIAAKALTVSGITAANKTYDGAIAATVNTATATLSGLVAGDAVTVAASGTFTDKNVGTGKMVTLASTYGGADAGNYAIADQASTTADINAKALTVSGITASNKTYDGTTAATVNTAGATLGGLVAGDAVTINATGTFADKNVGTGKTVTLASTYGGADAGNYAIADQMNTTADITPAVLTITANAASKLYDGLAYSGGNGVSYSGFVNGETSGVLGGSLAYSGTSQGAINAGSYVIIASGLTSGNYAIGYADGTLTVDKAALTVTANNAAKAYDGFAYSGGSGVNYSGFVNGETSAVLGGSLAYGGTSQGASNTGSYSIIPSGLASGNYTLAYAAGTLTIADAIPTKPDTPSDPTLGPSLSDEHYLGALVSAKNGKHKDTAPEAVANLDVEGCGQQLPPSFMQECQ